MTTDPAVLLTDAAGKVHAPAQGTVRIVSLVPSLTEMLCDLGLADRLVGRTGFCIHPRDIVRQLAKVGGTKDVRIEAVQALAPTHLIVNIDENRYETVEALARIVPHVIVTHPCTPEDNFGLYRLFGALFGCEAAAERLCDELHAALGAAHALRDRLPPEEVLYLIWREPWMSVAHDTYIAATLAAVGWHNLSGQTALRYPTVDWADPRVQRVARVFLSTEPYRFGEQHLPEVEALAGRPASLIDGEMCSWYGSRAAAGLRYLAALRQALAAGAVRP